MKDKVRKYFRKQIEAFDENFTKSKKKFDVEAIHQMRLSIKRTKAVFQFFEHVDPVHFNARDEFRTIRKLFKLSGEIRDVQVQLHLLGKWEDSTGENWNDYRKFLQNLEQKAIRTFRTEVGPLLIDKEVVDHRKIEFVIGNMPGNHDLRYLTLGLLRKKMVEMEALVKNLSVDDNIHRIRILVKQIHYLYDFSQAHIEGIFELRVPKADLKKTERLLGDWHDRVNALVFLQKFLKKNEPVISGKYTKLGTLIGKEKNQFSRQIKKILTTRPLFGFPETDQAEK